MDGPCQWHTIGMNRPFERDTILIDLLHGAFGYLKDRSQVLPSERALILLNEFTGAA